MPLVCGAVVLAIRERPPIGRRPFAFLDGLLFHYLSWNLQKRKLHTSFLSLRRHEVVNTHLPFPAQNMQLRLPALDALGNGGIDLVYGDRSIHGANVN